MLQFQAEFGRLVPPVNFDDNIKKGLRGQTDVIIERPHKATRLEKDLLGASVNEVDSSMKQSEYLVLVRLKQIDSVIDYSIKKFTCPLASPIFLEL